MWVRRLASIDLRADRKGPRCRADQASNKIAPFHRSPTLVLTGDCTRTSLMLGREKSATGHFRTSMRAVCGDLPSLAVIFAALSCIQKFRSWWIRFGAAGKPRLRRGSRPSVQARSLFFGDVALLLRI